MNDKEKIKAPFFSLYDQNGEKKSLPDFGNKWLVLYFYSKDNTSGCTREAMDFSKLTESFSELGAVVAGISPDSQDSHLRFSEKNTLKHILLSDPEKETVKAFGAWERKKNYGKVYEGVKRSTFLIDPDGNIRHSFLNVKVDGHAEKVFNTLKEIIASDLR
jgi:peroxiredoxin Q/BCP